jgi:hypothetical protein
VGGCTSFDIQIGFDGSGDNDTFALNVGLRLFPNRPPCFSLVLAFWGLLQFEGKSAQMLDTQAVLTTPGG